MTGAQPSMQDEIKSASEIAKDPLSISIATYAWVFFLSMWGGVVRIMREIKLGGKTWREIAFIFACELLTSGFAGLLTFFACQRAEFDPMYSAVMIGVAGYMGGRALSWFEEIYKGRTRRKDDQP